VLVACPPTKGCPGRPTPGPSASRCPMLHRLLQRPEVGIGKVAAEMPHAVEDVDALEVRRGTGGVDVARRLEPVLLEEDEADAPAVLLYELPAVAAARAARGGTPRAIDARHTAVSDPELGRGTHAFRILHLPQQRRARRIQRLEERLR